MKIKTSISVAQELIAYSHVSLGFLSHSYDPLLLKPFPSFSHRLEVIRSTKKLAQQSLHNSRNYFARGGRWRNNHFGLRF